MDKASVACADVRAHPVSTTRDVIIIGASEGSLSGLRRLLSALPASLPAAVLVVLHAPLQALQLDLMLDKTGFLPTVYAEENQALRKGYIHLADLTAKRWPGHPVRCASIPYRSDRCNIGRSIDCSSRPPMCGGAVLWP